MTSVISGTNFNYLYLYRQLRHPMDRSDALFTGGAQKVACILAAHFSKQTGRVYFASDDEPANKTVAYLLEHGVEHIHVPMNSLAGTMQSVLRLKHIVRAEGIDLVHCHDRRTALHASLVSWACHIPMVYTAHNVYPDKGYTAWFFGRNIVAVSETVRENLIHRFGISDDCIRVIHDGVSLTHSSQDEQRAILMRYNLSPEHRIVACVGRLVRAKGYEYLLNALCEVAKREPALRVLVVGDGPMGRWLMKGCRDLALDRNVIFCGFQDNVAAFIDLSEFTVLCSIQEGFGLSVAESLCLGKPVLATRVGGIPEMITDGVTGVLVNPRDVGGLVRGFLKMLSKSTSLKDMGLRGQALVADRFSLGSMLAGYQGYYERVLGFRNIRVRASESSGEMRYQQ